jgi:serine/threonine protein kinase
MGVVYLAHRSDDYQHEVAVKALLPGAESEEILRRFLAERQFLASLNHPSIVHMIDGGTTQDGAAYIVMEYVDGLPLPSIASAIDWTCARGSSCFASCAPPFNTRISASSSTAI